MGSKSKNSSKTAQYNYGGQNMSEADAMAKYQSDLASWRAPTSTGATPADLSTPIRTETVPTVPAYNYGNAAYNPVIPAFSYMPTAPTRNDLASAISGSTNTAGSTVLGGRNSR